jgi:hypothetical protein
MGGGQQSEADAMFPSTSELAYQYKQSTWYQAVTKDLGAERAAGRKQYYVIRETYHLLAHTFSFTTRAHSLIIVSPSMAPRRTRKTRSSPTVSASRSSRRCGF